MEFFVINIEFDFLTIVDNWTWQVNPQTGEKRLIIQLRNMKGKEKSKEVYIFSLDKPSGERFMTFLGMLGWDDPRLK